MGMFFNYYFKMKNKFSYDMILRNTVYCRKSTNLTITENEETDSRGFP